MDNIIQTLDAQIKRLQQARQILAGGGGPVSRTGKPGRRGPRKMSQEARDRIAASQRRRWARVKAGKKK